jgi:hypothetical protein
VLGVESFRVCILLVLVNFGFLKRIEFGSTSNVGDGYACGNTLNMLGILGIDCVVQDCNIQGGRLLDIMRDPTIIEACGLNTRLKMRFNGSGNEVVVSKIQMQDMQQQMNITTGM